MISSIQRLAVLGSPISHSRSPAIHSAAYRVLGLRWEYSPIEVTSGQLQTFLSGLDDEWRGLSLTMPLKREVLSLLDERDGVSHAVGAANTVLFDSGSMRGFNTDVYGAERMLREALPDGAQRALILGSGATTCSLVAALSNMGVREIVVTTRSPGKATEVESVAAHLGVSVTIGDLDVAVGSPDVVLSSLPGTAPLARQFSHHIRESIPLVDVAYSPWPTPMARHWVDAGGGVINNGLGMLVYQALAQIRIFVGGDPAQELHNESSVLAAMREAVFGTS